MKKSLNFIQLSDTHLLKLRPVSGTAAYDPARITDDGAKLKAALRAAIAHPQRPDLLFLTGDLMHEGTAEDYRYLRDRGKAFSQILRAILEAEGTVPFHCTTGKNRTGVLTAFLLLADGVDRETVTAEYACTGELLRPLLDKLRRGIPEGAGRERAEAMLAAAPAYIGTLIDYLKTRGCAKGYLRTLGFTDEEIAALNRKLAENGENHEQNCA